MCYLESKSFVVFTTLVAFEKCYELYVLYIIDLEHPYYQLCLLCLEPAWRGRSAVIWWYVERTSNFCNDSSFEFQNKQLVSEAAWAKNYRDELDVLRSQVTIYPFMYIVLWVWFYRIVVFGVALVSPASCYLLSLKCDEMGILPVFYLCFLGFFQRRITSGSMS